ncbi:MAG: tape measure protein [Prolixibacteraceae bacterium]
MNNEEGKIWYSLGIDDAQIKADAAKVRQEFRSIGNTVESEGARIDKTFSNIGRGIAAYLSVRELAHFGQEVIKVRGEFQQLGIAFETMLGSKEKSDQLMQQSIALAQKTPFTLLDITTNTKQLMAMGIAYEDVMGTMKALGDVAAGVSVPISRIAINYGQVATLGKLQQREIRDFAMAGVPIVDQLATNLGRAKDEIYAMVSAGQIGFPEVEKAFQDMSSEGGQFYNLMERQNASVTGQISNLTDKLQVMLNSIGQANEGVIYSGISGLGTIIENYEAVLDVLTGLIAVYGGYKAATMLVSAYEAVLAKNEAIRANILQSKIAVINQAIAAQEAQAAQAAAAAAVEAAAARAEAATEAMRQTAQAKTVAAKQAAAVATAELIAAEKAYAITVAETSAAHRAGLLSDMQAANLKKELATVEAARTAANKANAAVETAITNQTVVNAKIEATAVTKSEAEKVAAKNAGIAADREKLISTQTVTAAEVRAARAQQFLNKTMLGNPYVLAAVGLTILITALVKFNKESEKAAEVSADFKTKLSETTSEAKKLFKAITDSKAGSDQHAKAIQAVNDKYKEYLPNLLTEKTSLEDIKKAQDAVTASMARSLAFKAQGDQLSDLKTNVDDQLKTFYAQIDRASNRLTDTQKGQFKGLVDQYKEQITESFKTLGYFPQDITTNVRSLFSQISGESLSGWNTTGIEMAIKGLVRSETELEEKTEGLKITYESYLKALGLTGESEAAAAALKTVQEQIVGIKDAISEAEKKLADMRLPNSVASIIDIEDQEKAVKELKDKLEILTGIKKKEQDKQLKSRGEQLEAEKDLNQLELDLKLAQNKAIVAVMAEGVEKQKELARIAYEEELLRIKKEEDKQLAAINEAKGLKITDKGYITALPADAQKAYTDQRVAAEWAFAKETEKINEAAAKAQKQIWDEATEAFLSDVDREKRAINEKYNNLIKQARDNGAVQEEIDALNTNRASELGQVQSNAALKLSSFYQQAFGDIEKYGTAALKSLKEQVDEVIDSAKQIDQGGKTLIQVEIPTSQIDKDGKVIKKTVTMTIEEFNNLQNKANDVKRTLESKNPFAALGSSFKDLKKAIKSGDKDATANAFESFLVNAENALGQVKQLGAGIREAFGDDAGDAVDVLTGLGEGALNIAQGISTGNPVAVLQGVLKVYSVLTAGAKEYKAAQKAWLSELIQLQIEYNAVLNEQIRLQADANVFLTDYVKTAKNAYVALIDAQKHFRDELYKSTYDYSQGFLKGLLNPIKTEQTLNEFLSDLQVKIGVKKKKFLGITTGSKDVYGSLLEEYPELIDKAGQFNDQLAETLLDLDGLPEKTKQALEALIEYQQEIEAANEAIADAVKNLAGSLASDLSGALRGAWADGTDGFRIFKNIVREGLEDIISELAYNSVFSGAFNQLQEDMTDALTSGGKYDDIMDAYENFYSGASGLVDQYNSIMDANKKAAEAAGFDWSAKDTAPASGLTRSAQTLTEETGGELAGIWRKTSDDTRMIRDDMRQTRDYSKEIRDSARQHLERLVGIEQNTFDTVAELKNAVNELKVISTNTKPSSSTRDLGA